MNTPSSVSRETFQQFLASAFAVQQSRISRQCLSDIMDLQRSIASGKLDLDGAMGRIVESARNVASASGVAIALLKRDQLFYRAGSGTSAAYIGRHMTASLTVSANTNTNREILRVEDARTDSRIEAAICRQFDANSLLILPIYQDRALAGVLQVLFREAHAFQEHEVSTYRPRLRPFRTLLPKTHFQTRASYLRPSLACSLKTSTRSMRAGEPFSRQ
jgi:transcriptional regulator with GAF, ATPase, and Fis domain